jgi:hypothetical protein
VALECVKRHEQVARSASPFAVDRHVVAQAAQDPCPALGRDAVTRRGAWTRRRDDRDLQRAQVRKPAQTSRRSGV